MPRTAKVTPAQATLPEVAPIETIKGKHMTYEIVDMPTDAPTPREHGENPLADAGPAAKSAMTTTPGKALALNTTAAEYMLTLNRLYAAGRAVEVSIKIQATATVDGNVKRIKATKDGIAGLDAATIIRITFWAVPLVKRPRKPVVPATTTATDAPASNEAVATETATDAPASNEAVATETTEVAA